MRRFLARTSIFLLAVIAVCTLLVCVVPYNPDGYILAQGDKMAMLADSNRRPSIVLLGGSTVAFGYNSELIENETGMSVLNCGLHASLGMKCILDEAAPLLKSGDILVFVPEIDQFYDRLPYGELEFTDWMVLSHFRSASQLSWQQWWSVANNMPAHIRRRIDYWLYRMTGKLEETVYRRSALNKHGDMIAHWDDSATVFQFTQQHTFVKEWNDGFFSYYLNVLKQLQQRGIRIIILPTPLAESEFNACQKPFMQAIECINASVFPYSIPFEHYVMPDSMFYDTPYHLRKAGADTLSLRIGHLLKGID